MVKTGIAFPEYISKGHGRRKKREFGGKNYSMRGWFLVACLVLGVGAIFIKIFWLQVIQGTYYRYLADNNRTKTVVIHAPRGIIFDRNNEPLVYNIPGFRKKEKDKTILLNKDEAVKMIAKGDKNLEVDSLRNYPYKEAFAHVLGYIGQISKEELNNSAYLEYKGGDIIGKMGIERQYESKLKGTDEKQLIEVDSLGKSIRKLGQSDPIPGENVKLTLDLKLQQAAYAAMKDVKRGAVVVSAPNGEILALFSKPTFDPNLFTLGESYKTASDSAYKTIPEILNDGVGQPALNRTISGVYPPGSTFKIVVAASGLESKLIDVNYQVADTGIIKTGAFSFANWYYTGYGRTEGNVNVVKGLKRSNDIFFYKLAEKIGVDRISKTAIIFGAGNNLGIDLDGEVSGTVPDKEWKKREIGEQWYLGDTYHYGIGQGFLLSTPLQVNAWAQIIANGGILYRPHLTMDQKPHIIAKKFLNQSTVNLIRQGMIESCQPTGVAWPFFDFKVKNKNLTIDGKNFLDAPQSTSSAGFKEYRKVTVACKTGTAQHGGEQTKPHSWITLFAPAYNPEVVVTVLAEESGEGSNVAGPIAKKVTEEYFKNLK